MNLVVRLLAGLSSRVFAVVLALCAAQFPVWYGAYSNALSGARLEAQARYEELLREAAALRMSVEQFIERHESNGDPVFQASGRMHRTTVERFRRWSAMERALVEARGWERPLALFDNFDRDLARVTRFEPGLPLTAEGAAWAFAGLLLAWSLGALLGLLLLPRRFEQRAV